MEVLAHCYKRKPGGASGADDLDAEGEEDSMVLLSAGADSVLRKWEPASRMNPYIYTQMDTLAGHSRAVLSALYCEAMDMFITGGDDCTIRLWPNNEIDLNADPQAEEGGGGVQAGAAGAAAAAAGDDASAGASRALGPCDGARLLRLDHRLHLVGSLGAPVGRAGPTWRRSRRGRSPSLRT